MGEWKEYSLLDFAEIHNQTRVPLSKMERSERQGIFPYYGASGIIDYVDNFLFDGEFVLISEDGENLKSRQTPIAFKASGKFWVNNHAHILKGKKDFHNNLIIFYFRNLDLNPYITGAVQPKLNKANLLSIPLFLPENKDEQKAIASVLSSLDDKINLLQRQNKTLEAMAETLFRQWFVEEAREDWEDASLLEVIQLVGGGTPKTSIAEYWDGDLPWLSGGDIATNHKSFVNDVQKNITEAGLNNSAAKLLPKYATVISARGTVGKYCLLAQPMAFSQSNYGILPKTANCYFFTYLVINHVVEELQSSAYGSVFDTITTTTFKESNVPLPSETEILQFDNSVSIYFRKMLSNRTQIRTIEKIRDTLLPKLMSGEVRVAYKNESGMEKRAM
jgi:type I restriction enzyme S subunit